jgi:hypothetical protein
MKIKLTSVHVDDQEKALRFCHHFLDAPNVIGDAGLRGSRPSC